MSRVDKGYSTSSIARRFAPNDHTVQVNPFVFKSTHRSGMLDMPRGVAAISLSLDPRQTNARHGSASHVM